MASTRDRDEPGLFLQLEIAAGTVRVTYAAPLARVGRSGLRPPFLNEEAAPAFAGFVRARVGGARRARRTRAVRVVDARGRVHQSRRRGGSGALRGRPRDRDWPPACSACLPPKPTFALLYTTEWLARCGRRRVAARASGAGTLLPWPSLAASCRRFAMAFPVASSGPWPLPFPPSVSTGRGRRGP